MASPSNDQTGCSSHTISTTSNDLDVTAMHNRLIHSDKYLGKDGIVDTVKIVGGGKKGERFIRKSDESENQPLEMVFTLVGEISRHNEWLNPQGGWRPDSTFDSPIQDAKINFYISPPSHPLYARFAQDWKGILANIDALHKLAASGHGNRAQSISPIKTNPLDIAVRHHLLLVWIMS